MTLSTIDDFDSDFSDFCCKTGAKTLNRKKLTLLSNNSYSDDDLVDFKSLFVTLSEAIGVFEGTLMIREDKDCPLSDGWYNETVTYSQLFDLLTMSTIVGFDTDFSGFCSKTGAKPLIR